MENKNIESKKAVEELNPTLEKVDLSEIEELEEIVAPACGCGCGGLC